MRRKRFKIPVLSRLTQAWIVLGLASLGGGAFFLSEQAGAARIALSVDALPERIARLGGGEAAAVDTPPERLAQPALEPRGAEARAEPRNEPYSLDADDALPLNGAVGPRPTTLANASRSYEDTYEDPYAEPPVYEGDVVITIDGKPANAPGNPADRDTARRRRVAANITLAAADDALTRKTVYGDAPAISRDGRKPSAFYARPYDGEDASTVSLIVGGLGLNRALTERAIAELPPDVTLAFAPYARDLDYWAKKAREAGHEVLIELPMESGRGDVEALGPAALLTTRTASENLQRLEWLLSRYQGYIGVTNYLGAKFSGDRTAMRPVVNTLTASGLAYFDDTGAAARIAGDADTGVVTIDRLISSNAGETPARVMAELRALEGIAEERGRALAKTPLYAATLSDIAAWARSLEGGEDLTLAPASVALKRPAQAL